MWDLPGPGIEPVSLALADGSHTLYHQGSPVRSCFEVSSGPILEATIQSLQWQGQNLDPGPRPQARPASMWSILQRVPPAGRAHLRVPSPLLISRATSLPFCHPHPPRSHLLALSGDSFAPQVTFDDVWRHFCL